MIRFVVGTAVIALAMEPISAAIHRFYGHGPGWPLHRSHHEPNGGPFEANDVIPAVSAATTVLILLSGVRDERLRGLIPVAAGMTLYGSAYAVVHDVYIHRRVGAALPDRIAWLERRRAAHARHHRTGEGDWGIFGSW